MVDHWSQSALDHNIFRSVSSLSSFSSSNLSSCIILYEDYNGYWSPLSHLYWSSSSKFLVSNHPDSIIEELIASYCPHCLTRYMEDEVLAYDNRCPSCCLCPVCDCYLIYRNDNADRLLSLHCTYCLWSSKKAINLECREKSAIENHVIASERESKACTAFKDLFHFYRQIYDTPISNPSSKTSSSKGSTWRIEDIEHKIAGNHLVHQVTHKISICGASTTVTTDNTQSVDSAIKTSSDSTPMSYRLQNTREQTQSIQNATPVRVKLLTKRMLRCRRDAISGSFSILMQPKPFPLDGDSSSKASRGKWWVKDMSAMHEVPILIITKLPSIADLCDTCVYNTISASTTPYISIKIENPKDIDIVIDISSCKASGTTDTVKAPFTSSILNLVTKAVDDSNNSLSVKLSAYEDELLREVSDTLAYDNYSGDAGDDHSHWLYKVCNNIANIDIPLEKVILSHNDRSGSSTRPCQLMLQLNVKSSDKYYDDCKLNVIVAFTI